MTLENFIEAIEHNRGAFKRDFTTEFETIYVTGSPGLIEEAVERKHLGIAKLAMIAKKLDSLEQEDFVEWLNATKRTATQVNEKLTTY